MRSSKLLRISRRDDAVRGKRRRVALVAGGLVLPLSLLVLAASVLRAGPASAQDVVDVPCSTSALITAITAANQTGGVLRLARNCTYELTRSNNETDGGNGLPVLTADITLVGGPSTLIRRSNAAGVPDCRIIEVAGVANVRIEGIFLEGGKLAGASSRGGGIYNKGYLILRHITMRGNSAGSGGAVFNNERTTVYASLVSGNKAETGGGIHNSGRLTVDQSKVENNVAERVAGLRRKGKRAPRAPSGSALGAGIYNADHLDIVQSTIARNVADGGKGESEGGGLYDAGGPSRATLYRSLVSDNRAVGEHPHGGGIFIGGDPVRMTNSIVQSNVPENCYPIGKVPGCVN
jgi:hypothetical protein